MQNDIQPSKLARLIERGRVVDALRALYADPERSLDDVERHDRDARPLLNFLDALAFAPLVSGDALRMLPHVTIPNTQHALELLLRAPSLAEMQFDNTAIPPDYESRVQLAAHVEAHPDAVHLHGKPIASTREGVEFLRGAGLPDAQRSMLSAQFDFVRPLQPLRAARPQLFRCWDRPAFAVVSDRPPAPDAFADELEAVTARGIVPMVVVEPWAWDWRTLLGPLAGTPCVIAFTDTIALHHAAVLDGIHEAVVDPTHVVLVLDRYPAEYLSDAPLGLVKGRECAVVSATGIDGAIGAAFTELTRESALVECEAANWLYQAGRRVAHRRLLARVGDSRAANVAHRMHVRRWYEKYKGPAPAGASLGDPVDDRIAVVAASLSRTRRRLRDVPSRIRIAHVAETIVDSRHAPTRLLASLVEHHDRDRFDVTVFSSEAIRYVTTEWPTPTTGVTASTVMVGHGADQSGLATIDRFATEGVATVVADVEGAFETRARSLADTLAARGIDVVVFHGEAVLHILTANACDVPCTVFFDHAQVPVAPGFDLVVAATEQTAAKHRHLLEPFGTRTVSNEMALDVTTGRTAMPMPRARIGLTDDDLVITTVSSHLATRATPAFVAAVAELLRRFPKAVYLPVGPLKGIEREYVNRFAAHGVASQVRPLGPRPDVLRLLASSDLYLNEFPFGSGVAVLEAMAVGCPVVTMYDTRGEAQGWGAARYFGVERAVRSCDPADYVDLADRLLRDPAERDEWSRYARERYLAQADPEAYTRRFEALVLEELHMRLGTPVAAR